MKEQRCDQPLSAAALKQALKLCWYSQASQALCCLRQRVMVGGARIDVLRGRLVVRRSRYRRLVIGAVGLRLMDLGVACFAWFLVVDRRKCVVPDPGQVRSDCEDRRQGVCLDVAEGCRFVDTLKVGMVVRLDIAVEMVDVIAVRSPLSASESRD